MRQRAAAVLAGGDAAREAVLVGGEVEGGVGRLRRVEQLRAPPRPAARARAPCRTASEMLRPGRLRVDLRHRLVEGRRSPAAEIASLQQHLRRIDERHALQLGELALAQRELALGVGILPADVVPVVDMQRQRHHAARDLAAGRQARQPAVGRRAAAAALRGVELDQGGGARARRSPCTAPLAALTKIDNAARSRATIAWPLVETVARRLQGADT